MKKIILISALIIAVAIIAFRNNEGAETTLPINHVQKPVTAGETSVLEKAKKNSPDHNSLPVTKCKKDISCTKKKVNKNKLLLSEKNSDSDSFTSGGYSEYLD